MSIEGGPLPGQLPEDARDARDVAEAQATRSGGSAPLDNEHWDVLINNSTKKSGETAPSRRSPYDVGDDE